MSPIKCLLCAKFCSRHFTGILSFTLHSNPIFFCCFMHEETSSGRLINLPKVTHMVVTKLG